MPNPLQELGTALIVLGGAALFLTLVGGCIWIALKVQEVFENRRNADNAAKELVSFFSDMRKLAEDRDLTDKGSDLHGTLDDILERSKHVDWTHQLTAEEAAQSLALLGKMRPLPSADDPEYGRSLERIGKLPEVTDFTQMGDWPDALERPTKGAAQ